LWLAKLWLAMALLPGQAPAAQTGVLLVHSGLTVHTEMVASLRTVLGDAQGRFQLHEVTTADLVRDVALQADLIVTVGVEAATTVLQRSPASPVYCTLLPQATYVNLIGSLGHNRQSRQLSALYLDQPFDRRLRMLRMILPQMTRLGAVLGPETRHVEAALRRTARAEGISLQIETIGTEKELVGALHRAMNDADALFAVPDPLVFSRHTAQNILLTAYRVGKPVIGYSRAYVRAGALIALHSSPAQVGREVAEILLAMPPALTLPGPRSPRYFSLEINERVARSFGLNLSRAEELAHRLGSEPAERWP
jgi:ABC-type uncharacterized transport system substrate-binding protein